MRRSSMDRVDVMIMRTREAQYSPISAVIAFVVAGMLVSAEAGAGGLASGRAATHEEYTRQVTHTENKFGIGCYGDTTGSPPVYSVQLPLAADLAGSGGWVTLFMNGIEVNATEPRDEWIQWLHSAYASKLCVVVRLGTPWVIRDAADDASGAAPSQLRLRYTRLGDTLASVVSKLPLPSPDVCGGVLRVMAGNELNVCNEWRCSGPSNLTLSLLDDIAKEVAGFMADVGHRLAAVANNAGKTAAGAMKIQLANAPIANWQYSSCQCGTNAALGPGQEGLPFLAALLAEKPQLYDPQGADAGVSWLSSHSYPFSGAPWGTVKASRGLLYFQNESVAIGRPEIDVVITETGWATNKWTNITASQQAEYSLSAMREIYSKNHRFVAQPLFFLGVSSGSRRDGSGPTLQETAMLHFRLRLGL